MPDPTQPDQPRAETARTDDELWRTAIHEAGHAVAAVALGVGQQGVELFKEGKDVGDGRVRYGQTHWPTGMSFERLVNSWTDDQRFNLAVVALAGDAAELEVLRSLPRVHTGDEEFAEYCLEAMTTCLNGQPDLQPARLTAVDLLVSRRQQVIAVAAALFNSSSHCLSGERVVEIIKATPLVG